MIGSTPPNRLSREQGGRRTEPVVEYTATSHYGREEKLNSCSKVKKIAESTKLQQGKFKEIAFAQLSSNVIAWKTALFLVNY